VSDAKPHVVKDDPNRDPAYIVQRLRARADAMDRCAEVWPADHLQAIAERAMAAGMRAEADRRERDLQAGAA
jgi:hypothetical protein